MGEMWSCGWEDITKVHLKNRIEGPNDINKWQGFVNTVVIVKIYRSREFRDGCSKNQQSEVMMVVDLSFSSFHFRVSTDCNRLF
jgi:hypothetical protein